MALPIRPRPIDHPTPRSQLPEGADTLYSRQYLHLVELLSEGEIVGLVNDGSDASAKLKSVFLDGTPIRNPDGTYNFKGIAWAETVGTNDQPHLPGFASVETETAVGVAVVNGTPVVRTINDLEADSAVITLELGALYKIDLDGINGADPTGDMLQSEVDVKIEVQAVGSGFNYAEASLPDLGRIAGKATKAYDRSYSVRLIGTGPWNIRVSRTTPEDTDAQRGASPLSWKSYTTVLDEKLRYPNSALVALEIPAAAVGSTVPARSYLVKGRKVSIPSNYDPVTRVYTGPWDGTFVTAWTDNPAWCCYDLLTNSRYGLGEFLDASSVNKWGLYTIGQYCDELVDDGKGGTEPRFTCNLYLQGTEDAYRVVRDFASIFRAMPYWASGAVQVTQDSPADSEYLFTPSNVVGGLFTYSSSSKRARHTVAVVSWNDPANHYAATREYVTDEDGISAYGYNQVEIAALGCTSQGQAQRVGRWLLFTERLETETVTFQTGLEGALRRPGAIVTVQDPYRAGVPFGGRVLSATTTSVQLDREVTLEAGKTYSLSVVLPDGTLAEAAVTTGAGATSTLALSPALSAAPQLHAEWVLIASDLAPTYYRILAASEDEPGLYTITALRHEPTKYAAVEQGLVIQSPPTSIIPSSLAPTGLALSEALYKSTAGIKVRLQAAWDQNPAAERYAVRWRRSGGNWSTEELVSTHLWEALDVVPGAYDVQVQAITAGQRTDSVQASYTVLGKTAPPADVSGLVASVHPLDVTLSWSAVADVDLDHYELRQGGTDWASATFLATVAATSFKWTPGDTAAHTVWIKAVDTSGNLSTNATSTTFTAHNAVTATEIADGAVSAQKLLEPPADNLVPNGYSEAGTAAAGLAFEGLNLVNDPANAFEGIWCRKLTVAASGNLFFFPTDFIPCLPGEQFYGEMYVKASAAFTGTGRIAIAHYDKDKAYLSEDDGAAFAPGTAYAQKKIASDPAPAGTCFVRFFWVVLADAADIGKSIYVDAMALRKMFVADLIIGNTIQTSNYAESGGDAITGAKIDSVGTALKVAPDGLRVGPYTFSDLAWRSLNALDGSSGLGQAFYKGSIDKTTRGGAPNIDVVSVQCTESVPSTPGSSDLSAITYRILLEPSALSDNIEAMTYASGEIWGLFSGTATRFNFVDAALPFSRGFGTYSAVRASHVYVDNRSAAGITGQSTTYQIHLLLKVGNIYGWSDQRWYHPVAGLWNNMTRDSTPPSGGSAVVAGGGSGGGGACPEFSEPVMLADGTEIRAEDLLPGMMVFSQREDTLEWGKFLVQAVSFARAELMRVTLKDGRALLDSKGHRFYVRSQGWTRNDELRPGQVLDGAMSGEVARIAEVGPGHVVKISVDGAQTFQQRGILSHNLKTF